VETSRLILHPSKVYTGTFSHIQYPHNNNTGQHLAVPVATRALPRRANSGPVVGGNRWNRPWQQRISPPILLTDEREGETRDKELATYTLWIHLIHTQAHHAVSPPRPLFPPSTSLPKTMECSELSLSPLEALPVSRSPILLGLSAEYIILMPYATRVVTEHTDTRNRYSGRSDES
jgi:hypothetical protein